MKIAVSCEMDHLSNPQMMRSVLNMDYIEFVRIAGYMPFMVCVGMDVEEIAESMDGLLLTGGKDISPYLYGDDLGWNGATKCNLTRDLFERDLYDAFVERGKPVFGICRGFQLIVIFAAGDKLPMTQDINKLKSVTRNHQQGSVEIVGDNPIHSIDCRGVLKKLIGREELGVNSFHHQGFVLVGKNTDNSWLRQNEDIFTWARSRDAALILEAFGMFVKDEDGCEVKVAGVQYHPERMMRREEERDDHVKLFQYTMGTLECEWEHKPPQITGTVINHNNHTPLPSPHGIGGSIRQDFHKLRK